jgi:AraC-like DNA-binding protein
MEGLVFGWRTALLSVAVAQLLILAASVWRSQINRPANRVFAALLVVLAGILTPWMIGFAGFYDHWRWLTFAPFSVTFAVGPLIWLYVRSLADGGLPSTTRFHLALPLAQLLYLSSCFFLPTALKDSWAHSTKTLNAGLEVAAALSLAVYGTASLIALRRYRRLLAEHRSDDARYAVRWLGRAIVATLLLLPIWTTYVAWDAVSPLGYFNLMGLYATIAAFALYIGVEGWRHAGLPFPSVREVPKPPMAVRDWARQGETWATLVRDEGWAADPELSLAALAAKLGTNTAYLSRATNEGLGLNFSTFVNGLRAEHVATLLSAGDQRDLLTIALDAGFASKASFNRAFKARFGASPSAFRASVSNQENSGANSESEANAAIQSSTPAA